MKHIVDVRLIKPWKHLITTTTEYTVTPCTIKIYVPTIFTLDFAELKNIYKFKEGKV